VYKGIERYINKKSNDVFKESFQFKIKVDY